MAFSISAPAPEIPQPGHRAPVARRGACRGVWQRRLAPGLPVLYRVVKIKGPVVHLDGNAPLAGRAIRFAATVKAVCARPRLRKSPTATCMARMGISTDASFFAPPRPSKRERSLA